MSTVRDLANSFQDKSPENKNSDCPKSSPFGLVLDQQIDTKSPFDDSYSLTKDWLPPVQIDQNPLFTSSELFNQTKDNFIENPFEQEEFQDDFTTDDLVESFGLSASARASLESEAPPPLPPRIRKPPQLPSRPAPSKLITEQTPNPVSKGSPVLLKVVNEVPNMNDCNRSAPIAEWVEKMYFIRVFY